jgi:hypothetical protein
MEIGFTGTREGLTDAQKDKVGDVLSHHFTSAHHGDCIGADEYFHLICAYIDLHTVVHPPEHDVLRAYCTADEYREPKPYLRRNKDIVDEADWMVACPRSMKEELRSGTWFTVRYARKCKKKLTIIYPDGSMKEE